MSRHRNTDIPEPDVTPLINVNLVILVMTLLIASHAAKLLPMSLPKAERTELIQTSEAAELDVAADGSYRLDGTGPFDGDGLAAALGQIEDGRVVLVTMAPKARYEALVAAVDRVVARPTLKVTFASPALPAQAPAGAGE